ncbi:hypothetical protein F5Y00DRAFT_273980 [Daldinia vernicosa]|uniref:uncharacterized protein n=1 Tax=Daldinia vernicosa TaxID=114800 RepID=UPI0020084D7D|nr:uncharacterized protein F5Y00DRAFT_273980 [Daldinia vernicosa]KAI0844551.1 hypothetical protein F5Y00DRAFT_273980 [Daldinia vernicosa]
MTLSKIEIPIPRLRPWMGGSALLITLLVAVLIHANILSQHVYLIEWMREHDRGWSGGFSIWFGEENLKTSWLPTLLYRSPHHQLAIAASIVNIIVCFLVMGLFATSVYVKKNFWQHWLLLALFIPDITLATTALLYNFIEHGITGRLDTYGLYVAASPTAYSPYGRNWMDFESWSCGLTQLSVDVGSNSDRSIWVDNCHRSQLGRWLLLPSWFVLCATVLISWFSFRGLPGWRGKSDDEDEVEGGEGRLRL